MGRLSFLCGAKGGEPPITHYKRAMAAPQINKLHEPHCFHSFPFHFKEFQQLLFMSLFDLFLDEINNIITVNKGFEPMNTVIITCLCFYQVLLK